MNPTTLELVLKALAALSALTMEAPQLLAQHWGKDHVQQAVQGTADLMQLVNTVAAVVGAPAPTPSVPVPVVTPPTTP